MIMKKLMLFVAAFMFLFGSATVAMAQDPVKQDKPATEKKEEPKEEKKEEPNNTKAEEPATEKPAEKPIESAK